MTKKKIFSTAICCLLLSAASANAGDSRNFAMVSGYWADQSINDVETENKFAPPGTDIVFNDGWGVQGRVGRWIDNTVAVEGMIEYTKFKADNIPGLKDDFELINGMVMARIAFWKQPSLTPYFASGLGLMDVYEDIDLNGATCSTRHFGVSSRLALGVDYYLMNNISLNLEGAYTGGIGGINRVRFFSVGAGAAYHF